MDSEPEEVVMMPFDRHWNTDDVLIFTKSEMAANRVMNSISDWLERKLFLKVNATKTKVVRPMRSKYLGFTFLKNGGEWKVKPTNEKKKKLKKKLSEYLKRGKSNSKTSCGYNQEAENHLQKPKLSKLEEPKRIQSGRYS